MTGKIIMAYIIITTLTLLYLRIMYPIYYDSYGIIYTSAIDPHYQNLRLVNWCQFLIIMGFPTFCLLIIEYVGYRWFKSIVYSMVLDN